jgi:uncharacterized protein YfaS (alpha-2-macroglobulin family)
VGQPATDGAVLGKVTDARGDAMPGAVLTLISPRGLQIAQATAATDGTYRLETPGTGNYILAVSAKLYTPKAMWITLNPSGLNLDVSLDGGARLTGTVRLADTGDPVPDAVVTLVSTAGSVAASATTDDQGRYRFGAPAGQYTLSVSHSTHQPAAVAATIPAEGTATVDVRLGTSTELSGTIRDPASGPVDGAKVTLVDPHGTVVATTITDDSGQYRFTGVRPGDYTLVAAGYASVSHPLALAAEQHQRDVQLTHREQRVH